MHIPCAGVFSKLFSVKNEIFHRYLCRQLKGGEMKIKMEVPFLCPKERAVYNPNTHIKAPSLSENPQEQESRIPGTSGHPEETFCLIKRTMVTPPPILQSLCEKHSSGNEFSYISL